MSKYALIPKTKRSDLQYAASIRLTSDLLEKIQQNPECLKIKLSSDNSLTPSVLQVGDEQIELKANREDPDRNYVYALKPNETYSTESKPKYDFVEVGQIHQKLIPQRSLSKSEKERIKTRQIESVTLSNSRTSKIIDSVPTTGPKARSFSKSISLPSPSMSKGTTPSAVAPPSKKLSFIEEYPTALINEDLVNELEKKIGNEKAAADTLKPKAELNGTSSSMQVSKLSKAVANKKRPLAAITPKPSKVTKKSKVLAPDATANKAAVAPVVVSTTPSSISTAQSVIAKSKLVLKDVKQPEVTKRARLRLAEVSDIDFFPLEVQEIIRAHSKAKIFPAVSNKERLEEYESQHEELMSQYNVLEYEMTCRGIVFQSLVTKKDRKALLREQRKGIDRLKACIEIIEKEMHLIERQVLNYDKQSNNLYF